tara:strand:+ start:3418 stop:3714 length:297 start_codon:yes stop_codon:yes gene_type:complete
LTRKNFTKEDLINIISKKIGFSKNFSKKIIEDLFIILNFNIKKGELNLKNFGTFKLLYKNERMGRNPKTKKKYIISSRRSVSFIPSKKITNYLNKYHG